MIVHSSHSYETAAFNLNKINISKTNKILDFLQFSLVETTYDDIMLKVKNDINELLFEI